MKKMLLPMLVIGGLLQAGCSTTTNVWQSQEAVSLQKSNADVIAKDIVSQISCQFPAARTVFRFLPEEGGVVGSALEDALRTKGFAVESSSHNQNKSFTNIAYTIDHLDDQSTYWVGVKIGPKYRLDRVYMLDGQNQLRPKSGFTVRGGKGLTPKKETLRPRRNTASGLHQSWLVQVFASSDIQEVKHHQNRLMKLGYSPHIVSVGTTGRMKAIRLGPFSSNKHANFVKKTIRLKLFDDAFVVSPTKVTAS